MARLVRKVFVLTAMCLLLLVPVASAEDAGPGTPSSAGHSPRPGSNGTAPEGDGGPEPSAAAPDEEEDGLCVPPAPCIDVLPECFPDVYNCWGFGGVGLTGGCSATARCVDTKPVATPVGTVQPWVCTDLGGGCKSPW